MRTDSIAKKLIKILIGTFLSGVVTLPIAFLLLSLFPDQYDGMFIYLGLGITLIASVLLFRSLKDNYLGKLVYSAVGLLFISWVVMVAIVFIGYIGL